jgi:beta-lactamase regulating signal transducer with metallopeptidase domain
MNWAGSSFSLLEDPVVAAIKLTIILGLPWLAGRALGRQSAAQRHRVWVAGIFGALMLPLLTVVPLRYSGPLGNAAANLVSRAAATTSGVLNVSANPIASPAQDSWHNTLAYLLMVIWVLGTALLGLRLLVGIKRLGQIVATCSPLRDIEWSSLVAELSDSLEVKRHVRLLLSTKREFIPVTWGVLRSRIVLPADAKEWPAQRRRIVLAHELAHVGRQDWLLQMSAELMCCAYWFHPLAWNAARRLRQESERACDDAVLNAAVPASDYAWELLELAQTLGSHGRKWAAALAIVRPSNLERRLEAMLGTSVNRSRLSRKTKLAVAAVAFCLLLPLAAFRLPAQTESSGAPSGWLLAGNARENYLTGIDREVVYQGHLSAYLRGKPSATQGFGTLMQEFSAAQYAGQRVRLSAAVKSEEVNDWAGLWMRVDQGSRTGVAFDNMLNRSIKGTTGWQNYAVVLDVPKDSTLIAFGVLLSKGGTVWLSDVKFEIVGSDVPTTGMSAPAVPEGPTNLSFER